MKRWSGYPVCRAEDHVRDEPAQRTGDAGSQNRFERALDRFLFRVWSDLEESNCRAHCMDKKSKETKIAQATDRILLVVVEIPVSRQTDCREDERQQSLLQVGALTFFSATKCRQIKRDKSHRRNPKDNRDP